MRRRIIALGACLLLIIQMTAIPAGAAETVYFTAVNRNVLELSDSTMPFWSGGYLYVPTSIFTGVGKDLGVGMVQSLNPEKPTVTLYGGDAEFHSLVFDLNKDYAVDDEGNMYFQRPILRGGVVFLPISLVARTFGLLYSITEVSRGYLVWVRTQDVNMSERLFADAATSQMESRYSEYIRDQSAGQSGGETEEETPAEETPAGSQRQIYLCIEASDPAETAPLLNTLSRYGEQAAFYCTADFLEQGGDLLRQMAATGQAIGLAVDAADESMSVTEQLEAGNQALWEAAFGKTRLVWVMNPTDQALEEAAAAGYRCLSPDMDRSAYGLSGTGQADTLLQRLESWSGAVSVWLGGDVSASGLGAFLSAADAAGDTCLAVTETTP